MIQTELDASQRRSQTRGHGRGPETMKTIMVATDFSARLIVVDDMDEFETGVELARKQYRTSERPI